MPRPLLHALRGGRAITLGLLGPVDALVLLAAGRGGLPPLRLRRHTGPVRSFERAARETAALIESLGVVFSDDLVLDAGCGPGAMAPSFARLLGPGGRYVGFDMHAPALRWCRRRFSGDPRLRFEPIGGAAGRRFPSATGETGFLLAKSLFTHLPEDEARRYLSEIRRVLRPGAAAVVTAFLFEPGDGEARASEFFPFSSPGGLTRWRWKARPESAIAFEKSHFLDMIAASGLRLESLSQGFCPGASVPRGQDVLLLSHGERRRRIAAAANEP